MKKSNIFHWSPKIFVVHGGHATYDPKKYGSRSFLININPNDVKNSGKKFSKKIFEKNND